jgi:chromosome segregation ATPase
LSAHVFFKFAKNSVASAVSIVTNKNAAKDAEEEAADATEFLANLKKTCADKEAEFKTNQATRADEIEAIGMAIEILNQDDALDLFKKTLKTPTAEELHAEKMAAKAFLQVKVNKSNKLTKVRALLVKSANPAVNLLQHTLVSQIKSMQKEGKVDFSKVLKMIDDMVALLGQEQKDDESSKKWCEGEFDKSEDSLKELKSEVKTLASAIEEMKDEIAGLKTQIAEAQDRIAALDASVAEATEQRKKEKSEFTAATTANNMAIELIGKAKNKLLKFYNPD